MTHPYPQRPNNQYPLQKKESNSGRIIAGVLGSILMLPSMPCIVAALIDLIKGTDNVQSSAVILVLFSGLALISTFLLIYALKKPKKEPLKITRELERIVLAVAKSERGRLSTAEVALQTNLTIEESELVLQDFVQKQIADFELLADGATIYIFPAFMAAREAVNIQHQSEMSAFDAELNQHQNNYDNYHPPVNAPYSPSQASHGENTSFDFDDGQDGQDGQINQQHQHKNQHYKK